MSRLRIMACGRPKAGKTGMLAAALNAGFRIGLLDWDGNADPLLRFAPGAAERLSVIPLRDKLYARADGSLSALGRSKDARTEPQAMLRCARALDDWGKVDKEHPWGPVESWGADTILAFDSLTGCGDAAFNLGMFINSRDYDSIRRLEWQTAMRLEDKLLERLVGPEFKCHLFVTAHIKAVGPKMQDDGRGEDDDLVTARHAIQRAQAELLPTRYYPTALGQALPQEILRRVPASVLVESDDTGRWVYTVPPKNMPIDIGVPGLGKDGKALASRLPHATAFLDILEAVCGYRAPPKEV